MEIFKNNNEKLSREADCLKQLKCFVKENRDLDIFSEFIDDRFLLHFVRGRKYDMKKASHTLKTYFAIKTSIASKVILPSVNRTHGVVTRVLKKPDSNGRAVAVIRVKLWKPTEVHMEEAIHSGIFLAEEGWNEEFVEQNGFVGIFDLAGFNLQHLKACTPFQIHRLVKIFWNSFPLKVKSLHFVNEIYLFTAMFKTVKPFFPKKLQERVYMHGSDLKSLGKHFSAEMLPSSLGGNLTDEEAYDTALENRILEKETHYQRFAQVVNQHS